MWKLAREKSFALAPISSLICSDESKTLTSLSRLSEVLDKNPISCAVLISSGSKFSETTGTDLNQAWLRSVPVVSLNFDPDDINTAQDIGFLSKTSDNLERDVRVLLSSEQMRLEMGARAKLFSLANFHTPVTDAVYLREFRRLVNASQKL